jgi:hypothetical protein
MAAQAQLSLSVVGSGGPPMGIQTTGGPLTDTVATPVLSAGQLTLSSSFQAVAVPAGATHMIVQMASGNAVAVIMAGVNTDTGINLGSGWTWLKIPVLGGTQANIYFKIGSTTPVVDWQFF